MIRVGLLTEIISPYRVPVFNCLAGVRGIHLNVVFLAETEDRRAWHVPKEAIRFDYTILSGFVVGRSIQDSPLFLNPGIIPHLQRAKYDVIVCGGYQHPSYWLALLYAKIARKRILLWSESTRQDARSENAVKASLKRFLIGRYDGYIVPGTPQKNYLSDFNVPCDNIWNAPNAVDIVYFSETSVPYRKNKEALKREMGVRGAIVLYVGRLLDAKGVRDLLTACEKVRKDLELTLIVVGSGPDQIRYEAEAAASGSAVQFAGFQQQAVLPKFYGMADVFVLPTHSDTWGLVINEAMASGLPVISSTAAGAAMDLVQHGRNGYLFEPGNVDALATHIRTVLNAPDKAEDMGRASLEIVQGYSPERCAEGFVKAIVNIHNSYAPR
jgi:glycosyltransferase involved in cell wall biosynthesis